MPYFCGRCCQVLQLAKAMEAQDYATASKVQQESVPQTDNHSRRKNRGSSESEKGGSQKLFVHTIRLQFPISFSCCGMLRSW